MFSFMIDWSVKSTLASGLFTLFMWMVLSAYGPTQDQAGLIAMMWYAKSSMVISALVGLWLCMKD